MKTLPIITVPNPILNQKTKKIISFGDNLNVQINIMLKVLREEGGIGLAANQVGFDNRLILIEYKDPENKSHIPLTIIINPKIAQQSKDKESFEEGCLSIPQIELEVERPSVLKMQYQDQNGRKIKIAPKGVLARVIQHEIDHLNGILFTQRCQEQLFTKFPKLKNVKILFFGTGEFAAIILKGLILLGFNLDIITEKSKIAGRNKLTKLTAVAQIAKMFGKKYFEVENLTDNLPAQLKNKYPLLICADFGHKIPDNILNQATTAALNIHPSLLPKFRGPSPIQSAIISGAKKTGITIIQMSSKIDAGAILAQIKTQILDNDNYLTLKDRLSTLGLKLLIKILPEIVSGQLEPIPQNETGASKTRKLTKDDGEISWKKSPKAIERQIRAFYPWPGSYTFIDNKRLIIHQAHLENNKLVLDIVKPEGKNEMKFSQFLRGFRNKKPTWFKKIKIY